MSVMATRHKQMCNNYRWVSRTGKAGRERLDVGSGRDLSRSSPGIRGNRRGAVDEGGGDVNAVVGVLQSSAVDGIDWAGDDTTESAVG